MALDADEFIVASDARLYVAAVGASAPSDADSAPDAAFSDLGFNRDSGFTLSAPMEITSIMSHQSFYPTRRIVSSRDLTLAVELQQWNEDTIALFFGGATVTGASADWVVTPPDPATLDTRAFIADFVDGSKVARFYFPSGMVIAMGDVTFARSSESALPITIAPVVSGGDDPWTLFLHDSEFPAYPD